MYPTSRMLDSSGEKLKKHMHIVFLTEHHNHGLRTTHNCGEKIDTEQEHWYI